jgi:hypothetical protein
LSSEVFSEGADNKRRSLPNYAGRRNESDVSFDGAKHETSWSFSTFSEPRSVSWRFSIGDAAQAAPSNPRLVQSIELKQTNYSRSTESNIKTK